MAIDDHSRIDEAKELLASDFAREKTLWFMGHDVAHSISGRSETGVYVGKIQSLFIEHLLWARCAERNEKLQSPAIYSVIRFV